MARSGGNDGIRRRGGALFGELRKLELMRESGALTDERYRTIRARLMRSVAEADLVDETSEVPAVAPGAAASAVVGMGAFLTLGGAALAAIAMIGASPAMLAWVCLGGLATAALAACWEA